MAVLTINITGSAPAYRVGYRPVGSVDPYTYVTPNPAGPTVLISGVALVNYSIEVSALCTNGAISNIVAASAVVSCLNYTVSNTAQVPLTYNYLSCGEGLYTPGTLGVGQDVIVCAQEAYGVIIDGGVGTVQPGLACTGTQL